MHILSRGQSTLCRKATLDLGLDLVRLLLQDGILGLGFIYCHTYKNITDFIELYNLLSDHSEEQLNCLITQTLIFHHLGMMCIKLFKCPPNKDHPSYVTMIHSPL